MIHFLVTFSARPDETPFGEELHKAGVPHRLFGAHIRLHYRRRIFILLAAYPKLAWFALRSGWRSRQCKPPPDVVAVWSDIEVLVLSTLRGLLPGHGPSLALLGFIYTTRASTWLNDFRHGYYAFVLARCARVTCHSRLEVERYQEAFPTARDRFVFVPWGGNVNGHEQAGLPTPASDIFKVLTAGRSGRDYPCIAQAAREGGFDLTIICDSIEALGGVIEGTAIHVLRSCYDASYLTELRLADVVAIPLSVEDISAGQMVMIQAMAYGKPLIITRTPTISDYITDGVEGLLVTRGDAAALRDAVLRLRGDAALRSQLGAAGRAAYLTRFSQSAYIRNTVTAICGAGLASTQASEAV